MLAGIVGGETGETLVQVSDEQSFGKIRSVSRLKCDPRAVQSVTVFVTSSSPTLAIPRSLAEAIRRTFGYTGLRPLQAEAMNAALEGRDSLVVLATGAGKPRAGSHTTWADRRRQPAHLLDERPS